MDNLFNPLLTRDRSFLHPGLAKIEVKRVAGLPRMASTLRVSRKSDCPCLMFGSSAEFRPRSRKAIAEAEALEMPLAHVLRCQRLHLDSYNSLRAAAAFYRVKMVLEVENNIWKSAPPL